MICVAEFVKNDLIPDGMLWATCRKNVVWYGPAAACPLENFPPGTRCHVNPAYYDRLEAAVSKVEQGVPRDDLPSPA